MVGRGEGASRSGQLGGLTMLAGPRVGLQVAAGPARLADQGQRRLLCAIEKRLWEQQSQARTSFRMPRWLKSSSKECWKCECKMVPLMEAL